MRHNYILTASLLGGILLLAGCVKEKSNDDIYRPFGSEIVFGAATEYENGDGTRTVYSGDVTSGAPAYERIDWIDGDDMKIFYKVGSAAATNGTYAVAGSTVTANGKDSYAEIFHDSGTKLTWGSGGDHVFTAAYPASANFNGTTLSGNIPASQPVTLNSNQADNVARYLPQSMSYAYMLSKKTVSNGSTTSRVDLPFTPAMTAFQFKFKVKTGDNAVTVKKFEMTVTNESGINPLTGDFTVTISGENNSGATWNKNTTGDNPTTIGSNTGRKITVDFGSGVQMTTSNYLDFTVMALPVNISHVTITFTFGDSTTKSMKLQKNGNWVTFDACKKWVITNVEVPGGEEWDYYIEEIPDKIAYGHNPITATNVFTYDVKSYKVKRGTTTKVPVEWEMQYAYATAINPNTGEITWSSWSATWPTTDFSQTGIVANGSGYNGTTYQSGYSTLPTASTGSTSGGAGDATRAALASADPRGTSSNYFDLSMHPCYGNKDATTSQNTANCYIVSAPGYYKFPLVYGNAIKNGADNVISYAPESVTHIYQNNKSESHLVYQANFHNAINENITSPYILTDLGSYGTVSDLDIAIIWQDVPTGAEIIPYGNPTFDNASNPQYIQFSITKEDIQQGNVIIALRGKVAGHLSTKEILWSWHIWVTEKDLAPVTVQHSYSGTSEMAQYNLGWTDKTNAQSTKYPDRLLRFRVVQKEKKASATDYLDETFMFRQIGDATSTPANVGSNAFYQWGRKDPFLTAASANENKQCSTGAGYTITSDNTHLVQESLAGTGDPDFGYGIRHPYIMLKNSYSTGWVAGAGHVGGTDAERQNSSIAYNLWSAYVRGQHDKTNYGGAKAKTVYDPCPPGFEVPSKNAFHGFAGYTGDTEAPNTLISWKGYVQNDGVQFYRNGANGATIYLPFCGARGYEHTEIYDVFITAYYWTDAPCVSTYPGPGNGSDHTGWRMSKLLYFTRNAVDGEKINANYDLYKGAAYAIRPVLESVQRVNTDVTTGGMDGNTYDFNDGWTIN